jgi:MFS family permease
VRIGQALIGALGAYFLARYSWKTFLLVISFVPLIWLFPWYAFLSNKESPASDPTNKNIEAGQIRTSFVASLGLLRNRTVLGIALGFFAFDYVWFIYTRWLAGYLVLERKLTPAELGFWTSVPFLVMSVFILISGSLSDFLIRRGYSEIRVRKAFIAVGLAIAALIVPAGLVSDRTTALWLLSTALCGLGISSPNTWTLTQAVCSKSLVGTVSGIQNFGGNLGGILAPALTGFIAHRTQSFSLAFTIAGVVLVIGIFAYLFLIGPQTQAEEPLPEPVLAS